MPSLPPVALVHGESLGYRATRVLMGWLTQQEATQQRFGRNAAPGEDTSELVVAWSAAVAAVQGRPAYVAEDPEITAPSQEWRQRLDAIAQRAEVQAQFAPLVWRPALVDLRRVLSFQKVVATEDLDKRAEGASTNPDALLEICLPRTQPVPPQGAISDADGKGVTVSALNPNLRFVGTSIQPALVSQVEGAPPTQMQALTFFVSMGASYLQVIRYKNRAFLRDGYHRTAALLRAQVFVVPCVLIEARNFEEFGCPPGSLTHEVMYGDRPPRLVDFWDDSISSNGKQIAVRKVVRVKVEEFVVPR